MPRIIPRSSGYRRCPVETGCTSAAPCVRRAVCVTSPAINAAGNPVLNDMGGRCQLTRTGDAGGKPPFEVKGWCTYADKEGDQIFEECAILPTSPRCPLNGATGKFEGIRADLQIATSPIKSTYDGITQAIG